MGVTEGAVADPNHEPEAAASPEDQPKRIGRYLVLKTLGAGGMGVVYAAYDEELDRKVAVKLLHPAQQGESQLRSRIIREAQALARISAPNVVHVYEVGEHAGQLFIVMEFIDGTTLAKWQSEAGRSWRDILKMYCAAGQGLEEAHEAGLVHRDFKPDKVRPVGRAGQSFRCRGSRASRIPRRCCDRAYAGASSIAASRPRARFVVADSARHNV